MSTTTNAGSSDTQYASGYRIKFDRQHFVEIVDIANPKRIYKVKNFYYFAFDGFVMYSDKCADNEFAHRTVIQAIEFSNYPWTKSN